ncbi:YdaS family helix-turn-helix protein [Yersinia intermedia]|uniref:transcriptional regulator n=1 Tax=Yersinia intermedia TaxID=631 RepID=UPI000B6B6750|nr:YdaS family helix-turn-helix protein [Yersinia intermedia]MCW8110127.1 helix-turn-helix domain-containing protein [Yersinia intermedia]MDA5482147.1 YdaS family helix-turn-helix protein [Yersinia intermedia]MDA5515154.1 YdaS family helix-turn-helix protein [Yersinia intermedia]OWF90414.1 Rha family transcriptional regulator [Yersinia intermedia]
MTKDALHRVIDAVGSTKSLAKLLGISQQSIGKWKNKRKGVIPHARVLEVFAVSGITPHELRPDLYPNPTDGLPVDYQFNTSAQ